MIYQSGVTVDTFKQLIKLNNNIENQLQSLFYVILRAGKKDFAHEILKKIVELNNFGFSKLHLEVLSDVPLADKVNKASVTKAAYQNQGITPLHCACINPDPSFLEALLQTQPDMQTMDKDNLKAIHYAAVCESPEPLKLLLQREDVNILDIDKTKKNCLHYAAISGRAEHVRAILQKRP
jgi:ankyrin repeat protein